MINEKYIDEFGMVLPSGTGPGGHSDNGILFTAQARLLNLIYYYDCVWVIANKCFSFNGVGRIHRFPGCTDLNSPDNLIALGIILPGTVLDTLRKSGWKAVSPNDVFSWRAWWFSVMPGLRGLLKWQEMEFCPATRFFWNIGVLATMLQPKYEKDGVTLKASDRLLVETTFLDDRAKLCTYFWLRKLWRSKTNVNELVCAYFSDQGHPFRAVWK